MNLEAVASGYAPRSADVFASRTARKPPTAAALAWATAGVDAEDLACLLYTLGSGDHAPVERLLRDHLTERQATEKWRPGRADGLLALTLEELPHGWPGRCRTDEERAAYLGVRRRQWYGRWAAEYDALRQIVFERVTRATRIMRYRAEGDD